MFVLDVLCSAGLVLFALANAKALAALAAVAAVARACRAAKAASTHASTGQRHTGTDITYQICPRVPRCARPKPVTHYSMWVSALRYGFSNTPTEPRESPPPGPAAQRVVPCLQRRVVYVGLLEQRLGAAVVDLAANGRLAALAQLPGSLQLSCERPRRQGSQQQHCVSPADAVAMKQRPPAQRREANPQRAVDEHRAVAGVDEPQQQPATHAGERRARTAAEHELGWSKEAAQHHAAEQVGQRHAEHAARAARREAHGGLEQVVGGRVGAGERAREGRRAPHEGRVRRVLAPAGGRGGRGE
eukprot:scaffold79085_cov66-Phaeocystis_antarctica.AAC.1